LWRIFKGRDSKMRKFRTSKMYPFCDAASSLRSEASGVLAMNGSEGEREMMKLQSERLRILFETKIGGSSHLGIVCFPRDLSVKE
jgi:hypothetical protein